MDFDEVLLSRRSIRGYKQEAVPKEVIEEVLKLAVGAPSSMNTSLGIYMLLLEML